MRNTSWKFANFSARLKEWKTMEMSDEEEASRPSTQRKIDFIATNADTKAMAILF